MEKGLSVFTYILLILNIYFLSYQLWGFVDLFGIPDEERKSLVTV